MASSSVASLTELPNECTDEIDICTSEGILRLLRASDAQMFVGYRHFPSLLDSECVQSTATLSSHMKNAMTYRLELLKSYLNGEIQSIPSDIPSIVFTGCGTSGRLAYLCSAAYNDTFLAFARSQNPSASSLSSIQPCKDAALLSLLKPFKYLTSGSDLALVMAIEGAEDDAKLGKEDLSSLLTSPASSSSSAPVSVVVGITCGFSATYVAGQLDWALSQPNICPVLLGFNPVERARQTPFENLQGRSFADIVQSMVKAQAECDASNDPRRPIFLNPVVGPEPVTGSTRMKGGSATKMILDATFYMASDSLLHHPSPSSSPSPASAIKYLTAFRASTDAVYSQSSDISKLVQRAGEMMRSSASSSGSGGRLIYISDDVRYGTLGFIDASECVPTYGSNWKDVRGFVRGGWSSLGTKLNQEQIDSMGERGCLSMSDFKRLIMPSLSSNDMVILLTRSASSPAFSYAFEQMDRSDPSAVEIMDELITSACPSILAVIEVDSGSPSSIPSSSSVWTQNKADILFTRVTVDDSHSPASSSSPSSSADAVRTLTFTDSLSELALKLVINAITTGAHVIKGMTYKNRMINLRLSNTKLYTRACGIVAKLMSVSDELAEKCIQRSIYERPGAAAIPKSVYEAHNLHEHVSFGAGVPKVVPVALLLATGAFDKFRGEEGGENARGDVKRILECLEEEPIVRNVLLKYR